MRPTRRTHVGRTLIWASFIRQLVGRPATHLAGRKLRPPVDSALDGPTYYCSLWAALGGASERVVFPGASCKGRRLAAAAVRAAWSSRRRSQQADVSAPRALREGCSVVLGQAGRACAQSYRQRRPRESGAIIAARRHLRPIEWRAHGSGGRCLGWRGLRGDGKQIICEVEPASPLDSAQHGQRTFQAPCRLHPSPAS